MGWLTESRKPVKEGDVTACYRLIQYRYDAAGNMTKELRYRDCQTKDSESGAVHTISYEYDRENRRTRVSDCTGAAVEYRYDSAGRVIREKRRINDTTDQTFTYAYDGAGRLTEVRQSADEAGCGRKMAATTYWYDHNGNLTGIRLPSGGEIRMEYDRADRMVAETHVERGTGIRNTTRFSYDKAGNLTSIRDNRGNTIRMEYNLLNQEIRRIERDGGITRTFHDLEGRVCRVILPNEYRRAGEDGCGETYAYDSLGRLLAVTGADGNVRNHYFYSPSGLMMRSADGAGNGIRFAYDLGGC